MQRMQAHLPEMKAIQAKHKGDRARMNQELMAFYKENKINPAASCLPIVAQIPVFFALYFVLRDFDEEIYPQYPGTDLGWLGFVPDITDAGELALVRLPAARDLRGQPDGLDAADVEHDGPDAADAAADPAARLPVRRAELPGRPRPLLGDDQPVDGRAGADHAPAGAEAEAAREAVLADAAEDSRRRRRRRNLRPRRSSRKPAAKQQPRKVKRKKRARR